MKKMLLVTLLAVSSSSFAANSLNLPAQEYNYLNCLAGSLFKKPATWNEAQDAFLDHSDIFKSKQLKALFTLKNDTPDEGDAPPSLLLKPKKSITLLGLPISQISVYSDSAMSGSTGVSLITPKSVKETQAIMEKKYGKFANFDSPVSGEGFGISKLYKFDSSDGQQELIEHSITLKKTEKGKGTVVDCSILGGV